MTGTTFRYVAMPRLFARLQHRVTDELAEALDAFFAIFLLAPVEQLEAVHSLAVLAWGLFLLSPFETFASAPGYASAAHFGELVARLLPFSVQPENVWGSAAVLFPLADLYGLVKRITRVRIVANMGIAMMFAFLSAAMIHQDIRFLSTVVYPCSAASSLFVFIRLRSSNVPH